MDSDTTFMERSALTTFVLLVVLGAGMGIYLLANRLSSMLPK